MIEIVREYGLGLVAPSFDPTEVAATLNQLTPSELRAMKHAARNAAMVLNADLEMGKVIALYEQLFGETAAPITPVGQGAGP
jgi:hypothetical protein